MSRPQLSRMQQKQVKRLRLSLVITVLAVLTLIGSVIFILTQKADISEKRAELARAQAQGALDQNAKQRAALSLVQDLCAQNKLPVDAGFVCPLASSVVAEQPTAATGDATTPTVSALVVTQTMPVTVRITSFATVSGAVITRLTTANGTEVTLVTTSYPRTVVATPITTQTVVPTVTLPVETVTDPARTVTIQRPAATVTVPGANTTATVFQTVTATETSYTTVTVGSTTTSTATVTERPDPVTVTATVTERPAPVTVTATEPGPTTTETQTVVRTETATVTETTTVTVTTTCALLFC